MPPIMSTVSIAARRDNGAQRAHLIATQEHSCVPPKHKRVGIPHISSHPRPQIDNLDTDRGGTNEGGGWSRGEVLVVGPCTDTEPPDTKTPSQQAAKVPRCRLEPSWMWNRRREGRRSRHRKRKHGHHKANTRDLEQECSSGTLTVSSASPQLCSYRLRSLRPAGVQRNVHCDYEMHSA